MCDGGKSVGVCAGMWCVSVWAEQSGWVSVCACWVEIDALGGRRYVGICVYIHRYYIGIYIGIIY